MFFEYLLDILGNAYSGKFSANVDLHFFLCIVNVIGVWDGFVFRGYI